MIQTARECFSIWNLSAPFQITIFEHLPWTLISGRRRRSMSRLVDRLLAGSTARRRPAGPDRFAFPGSENRAGDGADRACCRA